MATPVHRSRAFQISAALILILGVLMVAGTPVSAVDYQRANGTGGSGACIHESGGDRITYDTRDGIVVYYPGGDTGYHYSGHASYC